MVRAHAGPQKAPNFGAFFIFIDMQNIQTLIFDLGGVIINLKTENNWFEEDLIPNFQPEKLHHLQQNNFFQDIETGKIRVEDFIQQLKEIAIDKAISDEQIIRYWNGILLDIPKHRVDLLKQLSKKYKLILLSNTNSIHLDFILNYIQEKFGENILAAIFHKCYYSQEISLRKPNKEIYEFVLQNETLQAANCIFFDDKKENLIEPEKLCIHTFLVDFNKLTASTLQHLL